MIYKSITRIKISANRKVFLSHHMICKSRVLRSPANRKVFLSHT